jgi:NADH dehydrogenase
MKPSRIVILGGTGFVGSHLVPRLAAQGLQITVLSRNRERHRELAVLPTVRVVSANVYDPKTLAAHFAGADAVINLVGILNERGFDGSGFRRAHVELTRLVIDAMKAAGVARLLQMSSLRAGEGESWYLKTRGEAEALVRASGLDWTIFRPSVIFGRGDGLFFRFAALLRLAPVMPLARAEARFAPVFVGDVCAAFEKALADRSTIGQVYELGGPDVVTLREIVAMTRDALGLRRLIVGLPDPLGKLQAAVFGLVPGKPLSLDNFRSLALDSVPSRDGLAGLGIRPTPMAAVVPRMLRGEDGKQDELDAYRRTRPERD